MSDRRFPLCWPAAKPRTPGYRRKSAPFRDAKRPVGMGTAINRLQPELDLIGAKNAILSTNVEPRLDGMPRANAPVPADPGAAIYFTLKGREIALACDLWDRVADNIVAIAKHIEALRGQDRWGVGTIEQAFAGYEALRAPEQWWQVLDIPEAASAERIQQRYRELARAAHPNTGGSEAAMARLNAARDAGLKARRA